mgnify:CR=1 FL=1
MSVLLVPSLGNRPQGIRIIILLHIAIAFSQIINLLSHTDLTNLTKNASLYSRLPSGAYTLGKADKRGRSDAQSVRFVRSV